MGRLNYSISSDPKISCRSIASELHISFKKTREICHFINGMNINTAKQFLKDVIDMKKAVPFKRHVDGSGHKRGSILNGRYPIKSSQEVLKLIKSAESNGTYKGLDISKLYIFEIHANRGRVIKGMFPRARGRASPKNTTTVNIEIILMERNQ